MYCSSYVIRCAEGKVPEVTAALASVEDLEFGDTGENGLAVAAFTHSSKEASDLNDKLRAVDGVLSATLVYHYFEEESV